MGERAQVPLPLPPQPPDIMLLRIVSLEKVNRGDWGWNFPTQHIKLVISATCETELDSKISTVL